MKLEEKYRLAVRAGLRQTAKGKTDRRHFMTLICGACWEVGPCLPTRSLKALRKAGQAAGWESKRVFKHTYGYRSYKMQVRCPGCLAKESA